jgi:hypothetical protein
MERGGIASVSMKKPSFAFALCGAVLGLVPAVVLVLGDRSLGHGATTLALLFLAVLGIPGMTVGSTVGTIVQHGARLGRIIGVILGTILGAAAGLFGALVLHETMRSAWAIREQDMACAGVFAGGILGVLLAGLIQR